jgi:phenylalanyl-tRNA synthetase beta chain
VKVPLEWLAELIDLPASRDELVDRLTMGGLEIEEVTESGPDLSQIVVGHVLEREPHPDADRLSYCKVDLGETEPASIVCGAPNVRAGLKVAVARPGTVLPDGTKLKKSKIRGLVSLGMICSARELGLGDDHEGILELDPEAPIGVPLPDVLPAGAAVLDLEITPNRGDWASMLGIAREVRAHFGGTLRLPAFDVPEAEREAEADIAIEIDDPDGCHAYVGRVVRGVRVGPSPEWLVSRLEAAGVRTINNIVDVTNLVLLELGQPLHAFDLGSLRGAEVRVRRAREGEKIATLDGQTRELQIDDLVIADAERAIAIAGVMGGAETEVQADTTDLLIESAHFEPVGVRRGARRLGLHTDASYRFERGVDPAGVARAADRCARLIAEIAGGEVSRGRVTAEGRAFVHSDTVEIDPEHPARLLGAEISCADVIECLARVDIDAVPTAEGRLCCSIPSYRSDLSIPEDLVEEVARVYGYDRIPASMPHGELVPVSVPRPQQLIEQVRDAFVSAGLLEARSLPMNPPSDCDDLRLAGEDPRRRSVRILNPIVETDSELRTSLVPGLLRAVRRNAARQIPAIRLFELGRSFQAHGASELPLERSEAAAVLTTGTRSELWGGAQAGLFFEAKGVAERVLAAAGYSCRLRSGEAPYLHPGASGELRVGKRSVGWVGELHPEVAARFEIAVPCAVVELDLSVLETLHVSPPRYIDVSPYPASRRDIAVVLAADQPAGDVLEAIRTAGGALLTGAEMFDRYEGKGVAEGKVSLAFHLTFQHLDRTLTDAEVAKASDKIIKMLERRFGAELR